MKFWDSSAIVPLIIDEPRTAAMLALVRSDVNMVVAFITPVEVTCALARRVIDRRADAEEFTRLLIDSWTVIDDYAVVLARAQRLRRKHQLRGADAIQLACALAGPHLPFVTLDEDLAAAARAEGFPVLP